MRRGVIAAGHLVSAQAGADALTDGGNAVDAALAALLCSCVAEPLLTGLGAGGYMLVVPPGEAPVLLDFFVEAPGRDAPAAGREPLAEIAVDFGDGIVQAFHVGSPSCGTYGVPAGVEHAARRFGRLGLERLAAPAAALAREGVEVTPVQAFVHEILAPIAGATPECAALLQPAGHPPRAGETLALGDLAGTLERLGREGAAPFYTGDLAATVADRVLAGGGTLTRADLAAYRVVEREPVRVRYRSRDVLLNPPPSAGGTLLAHALMRLERGAGVPGAVEIVDAMRAAQAQRTPAFLAGLAEPGFLERFLGATTHVSALDADGWACSMTTTNGEGSGVVIAGTGLHLNNMLGEEDLSPFGFLSHPPGRRLPSMMAPTVVLRDGRPEIVVGSAGSNRIRSAVLQVILNAVDGGMEAQAAVDAPRLHWEGGGTFAEPGTDVAALESAGHTVARFSERNLYFGGAQAVERLDPAGPFSGGGDPRRGGAVCFA